MVRPLRPTERIESMRYTTFGAAALDGMPLGARPRAILVLADDLDPARELSARD